MTPTLLLILALVFGVVVLAGFIVVIYMEREDYLEGLRYEERRKAIRRNEWPR